MIRPLANWLLTIWRGELGVARSTILLSGLGATILGSLGDAGMEAGLVTGGLGLLLFIPSAAFTIGFGILTIVAVWRAARRNPGIGAGLAVAFAILQGGLMFGDVGLASAAALGLAPSPLRLLTTLTTGALAPMGPSP